MSGCYVFNCLKTGDYYIGSAVCLNTPTLRTQLANQRVPSSKRFFSTSCRSHSHSRFIGHSFVVRFLSLTLILTTLCYATPHYVRACVRVVHSFIYLLLYFSYSNLPSIPNLSLNLSGFRLVSFS